MAEHTSALAYLRALSEYIEALERVRVHARVLADAVLAGKEVRREDVAILRYLIDQVDVVIPVRA
jgi:hypothetical protein